MVDNARCSRSAFAHSFLQVPRPRSERLLRVVVAAGAHRHQPYSSALRHAECHGDALPSTARAINTSLAAVMKTGCDELARLEQPGGPDAPGTEAERAFDSFTRMLVELTGMPAAAVTLADEDRVWISSAIAQASQSPRDPFSSIVLAIEEDVFEVQDACSDPRIRQPRRRRTAGVFGTMPALRSSLRAAAGSARSVSGTSFPGALNPGTDACFDTPA